MRRDGGPVFASVALDLLDRDVGDVQRVHLEAAPGQEQSIAAPAAGEVECASPQLRVEHPGMLGEPA